MSWIAKNSITGKTYGSSFECIYDCQAFIDSHLKLLEYEFRRAFALENDILKDIDVVNKSTNNVISNIMLRFEIGLHDFGSIFDDDIFKLEIQKCFSNKKTQLKLDNEIDHLVRVRWLSNNIIRCWYVEQNRFADGFDF